MNDAELFDEVLHELRRLLIGLRTTGVDVMLVGGQVLSLESLALGEDGVIEVTTGTGIVARRGYSLEPDLLFDVDGAGDRTDLVLDVLKQSNYKRVRGFRWQKQLPSGGTISIDLFMPPDADEVNNPGGFTRLAAGELAFARAKPIRVSLTSGMLEIKVPDPLSFIAMKLEAKLNLRPKETKDSFDIYAYVVLKGVPAVREELTASDEGAKLALRLQQLFGTDDAPGVRDVVESAGALNVDEAALLARAVVDTFDELLANVIFTS